jgi:hypothetical protein
VGWSAEPVGTFAQFQGGVDSIAFAPDGRAVAFTSVDTSCCSSATFGWARRAKNESPANTKWQAVADAQNMFVTGTALGAVGGPVDVAWFRDRFVAIGTRGFRVASDSDTPTPAIPTTWTSNDGSTWTAHEKPGDSSPLDLLVALDGESLLGLWTSGNNLDIRSTVDGVTWKTVSTITTLRSVSSLYGIELASISSPDDNPARYIVTGTVSSMANPEPTTVFVSMSPDGITWTTQELLSAAPPGENSGTSADAVVAFNGQILVYGTAYSELADGTPSHTALGWTSTDGGRTFAPLKLESTCTGTVTSVGVDRSAPEPTLFAVCTTLGTREGDSIATTEQLLRTGDGALFETPPQHVTGMEHALRRHQRRPGRARQRPNRAPGGKAEWRNRPRRYVVERVTPLPAI